MAIYSGFYNSVVGDPRTYHNTDFSRLMSLLINDGVFQNFGKQFIVKPGRGMQVIVQPGKGWFNERWLLNDSDLPITIEAAPIVANYKRIDTIAIKIDDSLDVRDGQILCIQGTPSEVPSPPRLVDSEDVHYHKLADILVGANVTSIIASNITNYVGTTTTPFITGILKTIDMTTLINQWHDQFERWNSAEQQAFLDWATNEQNAFIDWFNRMKDQLTEDAAGRLQTEVDEVKGQIHTNLLNPTLETTTINGVMCTNNGDGTYTLNGKASAAGQIILIPYESYNANDKKRIIKHSGKLRFTALPSGAGDSNFYAQIGGATSEGEWKGGGGRDTGSGLTFVPSENPFFLYVVRLVVPSGKAFSNLIVKPMLTTDLSATYDSFVKYSGSEERLNEQMASLHESSKGVITNLLNSTMRNTTIGGIICTANGDGTYTFNGNTTATANFFPLPIGHGYEMKSGVTYHLSGCPDGGSSTKYELIAEAELGTAFKKQYAHDYGNGVSFTVPQADIDAGYRLRITISIKSNVTNLTFKPMLTTDLDATYNDYVPYSGDGRLNENVAALFDMFHPVGTLYESVNKDFNPNTAKGWHGTWERIKDRFVYACGDSGEPGELGGSNTHKITSSELPAHNHPIPALTGTATGGNHRHGLQYDVFYSGSSTGVRVIGDHYGVNGNYTANSGNLSMSVTTNASNTDNNATYNTAIDIRPAFIRAYIWKRVS